MNLRTILISFTAAALIWGRPADAQASGGTLAGVVVTAEGTAVRGAVVTLAGNGLLLHKVTDSDGRFAFFALPIGTYDVQSETSTGNATAEIDLENSGAYVTLRLLKTVASTHTSPLPTVRGSGTDVVLNQTQISHSPAYGSLQSLLLQLPGAVRGANGVVHINGDHGDINFVVDGVPIPQALNRDIGSEIDPSTISFIDVMEGAYPAEYGGRFAAVINIDTKAASGPNGVTGYVNGCSLGTYDTDLNYHAHIGSGSFVVSTRNQITQHALDAPDPVNVHNGGSNANQFVRYALPLGNDFILATASHSYQTFQIPNDVNGGQPPNTDDDETQDDTFANVRFHHALKTNGAVTYGIAVKRSRIRDFNDPENDFAYGEALNLSNGGTPADCSSGIVPACAYSLFSDRTAWDLILDLDATTGSAKHTVTYGAEYDATTVQKRYEITLQRQNFISTNAYTVSDNSPNVAHTEGAFLQDSWNMGANWRLDYGARLDAFQLFSTEFLRGFSQLSPRVKLTREFGPRTDLYVYAGRFFTPFSFENVSPSAAQTLNEPLEPAVAAFDLRPQRDTDVEIGGSTPLARGQLGLRVMQKAAVDLIDDTQVGLTALHQDINYARGNISSQSAYYQRPLAQNGRFYVSLTHTRSVNKGCETQLLAPCFGSPTDWTPADHDQRWDAESGVYINEAGGSWFTLDGEYGSGLSSAYCQPASSECKVPPHTTFDLQKGFAISRNSAVVVNVYNVLNDRYRITYLNSQGNHYDAGRRFEIGIRF